MENGRTCKRVRARKNRRGNNDYDPIFRMLRTTPFLPTV